MTKTAILGLGAMGSRMARRLIDAGHEVVVYNRNRQRAAGLVELGATLASSPREAASIADVVMSIVTDVPAAESVWLDPQIGAIHGLRPGTSAVESSTVTPTWVDRLHEEVEAREARFVDAPVVGTRPHAENGQLTFLAGGDAATVELLSERVVSMGRVKHTGPHGTGIAMKLAVNAMFGAGVVAFAEAVATLSKLGVQRDAAIETLAGLPVVSPAVAGVASLIAADDFAPMFPIDLVEKDFSYMLDAMERAGVPAHVNAGTHAAFEAAQQAGFGGLNIAAVWKLFG